MDLGSLRESGPVKWIGLGFLFGISLAIMFISFGGCN